MDDLRFGSVIRLVRQRHGWRQQDLAERSGVSQSVISRIERGHLGPRMVDDIRAVAAALDIRVDLVPRWRAGDLDRLLNRGHSALHESVARMFRDELAAWVLAPEVSFAIYGERGVIDILAWHAGRQALLVMELKTDLADMNELVGTFDRKRRLARQIALERGWDAVTVSAWLIVVGGRTNRRRIAAHEAMCAARSRMTVGRSVDGCGIRSALSPASRSGQISAGRLVGPHRGRSGGSGRSRGVPPSVGPGRGRRPRPWIADYQSPAGNLATATAHS